MILLVFTRLLLEERVSSSYLVRASEFEPAWEEWFCVCGSPGAGGEI
jgi:hypothetical protein